MKLKDQVEEVLNLFPETRNSDIRLTIEIWKRFYSEKIQNTERGRMCVELADLYDLPREDNVKRMRAEFNSLGKYLPTTPEVIKQRRINEEKWREELGYPPLNEIIKINE